MTRRGPSAGIRQPEPLDVERLARALAESHQKDQNHGRCTWSDDHRWYAEQVAREYDALSEPKP